MVWRAEDPEGFEAQKIMWEIVPYTRGRGLDLGCGPQKAFPHFIGVDNGADEKLFGIKVNPDIRVDTCERLPLFASASMDFVFSSHLLEHIKDYAAALKEWWRVVKPGGYLVLYLPHRSHYPSIGQPGANPDHKHDFVEDDIIEVMRNLGGWDLVRNEVRSEGREYSFFQVFRKRTDGKQLRPYMNPRPSKRAAIVRYGAFGDLIQASSLFPGLKEQGYHLTVYTTPRGKAIIEHDPHVDEIYLQDNDQVPNHLLGEFWEHEAKKYDKFINLSESVEGTWLVLPGRPAHSWPHEVRHKYLNVNYMEFAHELAGVPLPVRSRFYASEEEKVWARKERQRIGGDFFVIYVLNGSSVHKAWPHMDSLLARMLVERPGVRIMTVGDSTSELLEAGWENESRVLRRAGKLSIRQTMALLEHADLVVGPETGVLNAAAMLPMKKIVFLSHSSPENLTKHWVNTEALTPVDTPCYPCHQLHYGWDHCHRHENGTALCQTNISVDAAWQPIQLMLRRAA